ncbi:MAG: hypothetical protein IT531_00640 [Burkholderiales bacterium]|nr:hypothetical protein [Burkholderiales bacterium]
MLLRAIAVAAGVALVVPSVPAQQKGKGKPVVQATKQRHQCKVGPYEKQTRLVMETVKDKPVYLAYWSSNGPFHCSFESWPGDGRATWVSSSAGTVINLISGTMLIEKNGDKYFVHAREVDRMPYCGTFGSINGVLTVPARKGDCDWRDTDSDEAGRLQRGEPPQPEQADPPPSPGSTAALSGR